MPSRRSVFLWMLCFTLPAVAEQSSTVPKLTESIEVSIVNLDVFVTDKHGAPVHGLTRVDFEIFENRVRQPITNFTEYSSLPPIESASAVESPTSTPPNQPRTILLFVDRLYLPKIKADPFFEALRSTLNNGVRPGDSATIVTWNHGVLRIRQQATDKLEALDRAIDQIAIETTSAQPNDFQLAKEEADDTIQFEKEAAANAAVLGPVTDPNFSSRMQAYGRAKMAQFEQRRKVDTLKALIRSVSAADGKKMLLLVAHRLSSVAGAEFLYAAGQTPSEVRAYNELHADADLKSLEQTANANGVAVYSMYPEGINDYRGTDASESRGYDSDATSGVATQTVQYQILENEKASLGEIAEQTGGMSEWGANSAKLLERVEDDLQNYYSLAYRPASVNVDRARDVVVKTRNPNLVVRSRRSVVAKSDITRMEDRVISALFRPPEGAAFRVGVGFRKPAVNRGKKKIVPIDLQIPISALTALPQGSVYAGAFSVYVAWGTKFERVSQTMHQTQAFRIPANDIAKAKAGYYTYTFEIQTDGHTERIALGVIDEISKDFALNVIEPSSVSAGTH